MVRPFDAPRVPAPNGVETRRRALSGPSCSSECRRKTSALLRGPFPGRAARRLLRRGRLLRALLGRTLLGGLLLRRRLLGGLLGRTLLGCLLRSALLGRLARRLLRSRLALRGRLPLRGGLLRGLA